MEIIERIADIHAGGVVLLVFVSCVYITTRFLNGFKQERFTLIAIPIFFTMIYKFFIDFLVDSTFSDYTDIVNIFVVIPLFLAPLFFVYGLSIGFKRIKNDLIVEVKKAKYLFFFSGLVVLIASVIAVLPNGAVYWPERSYEATCVLLVFLVSLLFLPPFFYALEEMRYRRESNKQKRQNVFYSCLYWLCLMSNMLILNAMTLVFVFASLLVFIAGQG